MGWIPARLKVLVLALGLIYAIATLLILSQSIIAQDSEQYTVTRPATGLNIPWDVAFTPDGTMLITERSGRLIAVSTSGNKRTVEASFTDVWRNGELGLMGIVVDPNFSTNRRFYTCQGDRHDRETQVIAWTINSGYTAATRANNPLVAGIPASNIHNGCRLLFGPDGYLYISTGDAAYGPGPQDLNSLAGKILRVNASDGSPATGNPFTSSANAKLVWSYGHRNPQGLAFRGSQLWAIEHGPDIDDEINLIVKGGNYGWDPVDADNNYNQRVPMTDRTKHPSAIAAKWSSGDPTFAVSGGVFLSGAHWGDKQGYLAVATLKNRQLYLYNFSSNGTFVSVSTLSELQRTWGRLRSPVMGPDNALYVTTSNGNTDSVLRVIPQRQQTPTDTTPPQISFEKSDEWLTASSSASDLDADSWRHKVVVESNLCRADAFSEGNQYSSGFRVNVSNLSATTRYCFAVADTSGNWSYVSHLVAVADNLSSDPPSNPGSTRIERQTSWRGETPESTSSTVVRQGGVEYNRPMSTDRSQQSTDESRETGQVDTVDNSASAPADNPAGNPRDQEGNSSPEEGSPEEGDNKKSSGDITWLVIAGVGGILIMGGLFAFLKYRRSQY